MDGSIALYSSSLIFSMEVWVWADDLPLFAVRSLSIDDTSEAFVVSFFPKETFYLINKAFEFAQFQLN